MSTAALSGAKRLHPGAILAAVCVACVLLPISLTGASVALPAIGVGLHGGLAAVQWVVNGYDLTFAGVMLAAGSLSDRIGRKRMFTGGLALFGLAASVSALAPNIGVLDLFRAVAGVGAAGVLTSGAAILATAFEEGPGRAKAFAMLGTSFGLGIAFGPAISGVEISGLGWRGVFVSHAVVAAVLVGAALRFVPESRNPAPGKFDWPGNITFTLALSLFILVLIQGPQWGWGSAATIACLVAFVGLLAAFPIVERRQSSAMFDVSLFVNPRFTAICLVPVALAFGFTAVLMLLPSYFSSVDGAG
ncbi:MAG TPA: MFS transporter, partial [Pseudonocardiaceae bacterium]|nr:MFS transporter [Pseudonocardiaceae bacterium]